MTKRIPLAKRSLPCYTRGEEIMNMTTHIVGGGIGIFVLGLCLMKSILSGNRFSFASAIIYGGAMICLYAVSSIYHGLRPGIGKKVFQVLDHCTIYALIAGTYTPILLCAIRPKYPFLAWGLMAMEWGLAILAATLTAIDLRKYKVFSMVCYILMGWCIIFFYPVVIITLGKLGFSLLFAGGIAYTIGAILFGIGTKVRWMHSVFHIFVVAGSILQFLPILLYVL